MSRNHNHKIIPSLMIFTGMIFVSMHLFCIDDPVESITGPSDPDPDPDPIGWSCIIPAEQNQTALVKSAVKRISWPLLQHL